MASQWEQIKWIPGTRLMVDGFRYQNSKCKSYLLTHFHSDHTTGLTRSFSAGTVFCTPVTARLLRKDMGLPSERICEIPMDSPTIIEGVEVTPICANHCPGACMFLLKVKGLGERKAQTILHTGDMRWSDSMAEHPALRGLIIDHLFMDTTYAKPTHTHPPQDQCIALMADLMRKEVAAHPRTIFVCGSYHIGKERAYLGVAKLLGWKVWVESHKRRVLKMLDLPAELLGCLATRQEDARIHVDFLGGLQPERLQRKLDGGKWSRAVGFRPTGWTFRRSGKLDVREEGAVKIYGIPYSEHSSWTELRSCVALLRPRRLVPTVNASNPAAARTIVNRFADLMDLSEDRSRLDFFLTKRRKLAHQGSLEPGVSLGCAGSAWATEESAGHDLDPTFDDEGAPGQDDCSIASCYQDLDGEGNERSLPPSVPDQVTGVDQRSDDTSAQAVVTCAPGEPGEAPQVKEEEPSVAQQLTTGGRSGFSRARLGTKEPHDAAPYAAAAAALHGHLVAERTDSGKSSTEHLDLDAGLTGIDVAEQLRILEGIRELQSQRESEIARRLTRKKQATLATFLGRC